MLKISLAGLIILSQLCSYNSYFSGGVTKVNGFFNTWETKYIEKVEELTSNMVIYPALKRKTSETPITEGKAAVIYDPKTRQILWSKRENEPLPLASLSKVMTAIIVLENCKLTDKVKVPKITVTSEDAKIGLKKGEVLTVQALLDAMLIRSANDAAIALAEVLHKEVVDLERAGAKYIQIDEPAISVRPCEIDLAIKAMAIVTDGVKAKTITHICYGDFAKIYPEILEIPVDMIDLELSNSALDMLPLMKKYPFTKEIGFGVIDVHTHVIETKEVVKERIRQALEVIPREKIYIDPDCGLKTRTVDETIAKLKVMVEAVQEL